MFCNTMLWIVASELIDFEINYPYMYRFGRLCNTRIWSLSKVFSMLGTTTMPYALYSSSSIILSQL